MFSGDFISSISMEWADHTATPLRHAELHGQKSGTQVWVLLSGSGDGSGGCPYGDTDEKPVMLPRKFVACG